MDVIRESFVSYSDDLTRTHEKETLVRLAGGRSCSFGFSWWTEHLWLLSELTVELCYSKLLFLLLLQ